MVIIADSKSKGYEFAQGVYEHINRKEGRQFTLNLADIKRNEFKDGEYKLKISHNIRRKKCFYIHDPNKDACKWVADLVFILDAMAFSSPSEINVVFPYMRFARQDRKDESRVAVNIKAIADIMSLHADRGLTVDLHTPQIQEFFGIPFDDLRSFPVLISHLLKNHGGILGNLVIVSPDAGGGKRVERLQKSLGNFGVNSDIAVCYKKRQKDNEVNEIKIMGDVSGKNCLILDDIIDTGNTLIKTVESLRGVGAGRVFAYGTHGVLSGGLEKFKVLDKLILSDSLCCDGADKEMFDNVEVISLVELFGEAIYRTFVGQSLSSLFD